MKIEERKGEGNVNMHVGIFGKMRANKRNLRDQED